MNLYAILSIVAGISDLLMCMFMLIKGGERKENRIWGYFCFFAFIWQVGSVGFSTTTSKDMAFFWWQIAHIGTIVVPAMFFHFVCSYLGLKKRWLIFSAYSLVGIFLVYNFFYKELFIGDLRFAFNQFYYIDWPKYHNPAYLAFYILLYALLLGYSFLLLIEAYQCSVDLQRKQLKIFILGSIVGWLGPVGIMLAFYRINVYPFSNILIGLFPIVMGYGIVRHQLMNIEVIIKKTLVFTGLLASVFAILVLPTLLIQEYILRTASFAGRMTGLTISGIIIILSMRRIESFLINITDKYLFQKKYDYKELLKTFTTEVLTVVNLDKLVNMTIDKLADIVKLNSCAVLLLDEDKQQFNIMASRGVKDPQVTLIRPDGIVTFLEQTHGYLLKKELVEKKVFIPPPIQEIMAKLNAELIIPMVLHDELMGVLSLGKKKSDEDYTQDDLDILLPLARTLAIAISNARLFDELGKTQAEAAQKEKMAVIGTLSAGINHEICNPLGIARGQCEAFLLNIKDGLYNDKSPEELLAKAKDIMNKVIKETDRATAITKKLSGFAKPAKGEAELVRIEKEIDDVLSLVGYELKLEKIEFEKRIDKSVPDIFVDRKQFQEVLFNLIRNAGQAIGEKGKITVIAQESGSRVSIDIKDTGSGIPEDKLKELFNPFFTTKEPGKGTGLGLFIVRQVVEKNGGRIYLKETKVGEGTTFRVEFPAVSRQEAKV